MTVLMQSRLVACSLWMTLDVTISSAGDSSMYLDDAVLSKASKWQHFAPTMPCH